MKRILFVALFLIYFSIVYSENKPNLLVKIVPSQTEVSIYTNVHLKAWLYNNGTIPISLFRQDYTAPAWLGVIENWYCTFNQEKDTFPKLMTEPSSGFNENNIIEVVPGDSIMVDTLGYTFYEQGSYTFTYNIRSSRRKVILYYAMTDLAKRKASSITEFNIYSLPLTIFCKPVVFSNEKILDLPLDEVTKNKKQIFGLFEAFKNPEEVFILCLEGDLTQRDLKAVSLLKNIHSLQLSNVNIKDQDKEITTLLDLPNLKELIINDSQIKVTDDLIMKFPKLEKLTFKNVIYHNPSKALNTLTQIKSVIMIDCQIQSLSVDFNQLQYLTRLEVTKNNLKEVPAITNLPILEYLDFQENNLTNFPDVFNNPSLKSLILTKNYITYIPADIGKLKALNLLDLSDNKISELPPSLLHLKKLIILKVNGNPVNENKTSRALRKKLKGGYFE